MHGNLRPSSFVGRILAFFWRIWYLSGWSTINFYATRPHLQHQLGRFSCKMTFVFTSRPQ
ncbi:hypothetical protein AGR5A_Cc20345 [Agrobacterium genomosp. 5 str. CFBP 6626]|nr:hypothetical protein AGR5A_Cc20345 [Agrobacterium genomosp. 5 str. CFBP 6626]